MTFKQLGERLIALFFFFLACFGCYIFYQEGLKNRQAAYDEGFRQGALYRETVEEQRKAEEEKRLIKALRSSYRVPEWKAREVVKIVKRHTEGFNYPSPVDVLAIMKIESDFDYNVVSVANAVGIMQVKGSTTHLNENVRDGISRLREYYNSVGKHEVNALHAYNVGITAFKANGVTNENYVRKFETAKRKIQENL
jgi:soluble lytic murein transglycosylase-like protein